MTKRLMQVATCLSALCLTLMLPVASHAQAVYGSITGTVTDQTGAAIPNATVSVINADKGTTATATSNGSGEFTVEHLIVDKYDLKIGATGFKSYEAKGIQIFVDTSATVKAQLQIGATSQTVEVSADSIPVLKTDRADVATVFTQKDIQDLPTGGRNFTGLELLLPGAQLLGWSHAADENPQGSEQIQVDGQAFGGVAYELDGTDNQDPILGIIVINPSLDALNEAKITTQNYDASFGKAVSAVVVASTKSGTNSFHGSAYDYRNSTANQATDPYSQFAPKTIPAGLKNLFGGSVGGPIWRDKVFFFGDYQGIRQKVATSAGDTVPDNTVFQSCLGLATGPSGIPGCDFSDYLTYNGAPTASNPAGFGGFAANGVGTIYQNGSGTPYPKNTIPTAQLSAPSIALLNDMYNYIGSHYGSCAGAGSNQLYCGSGPSNLVTNFSASGSGLFNANQYDVRIDGQVTASAHAFARFSRFTNILTGTQLFGPNVGGPGFGLSNYGGVSSGANDSFAAGIDLQVSPKWLTDFRLGYYRYNIIDQKNNAGVDYMSQLGIMGENVGGITSGSGGFQLQNLPGGGDQPQYGSFLNVNRCNCPLEEREDQFQVVNNWTRILGNHQIKFGADLRYARNLRVPSDTDRTGINGFGIGPTSDQGTAVGGFPTGGTGGLSLATFALGDVTSYGRYVSDSTNAKEFQKRTFFYAQDTWRITPNLTFNYGLRYELYFPEAVNGTENGALMSLKTGFLSVAGVGGIPSDLGWTANFKAFAPRIGLAYQLDPKTVIRAGYGRSYDIGVFGSIFGHNVTQNLPVLANQEAGDNNLSDRNNELAFNYGTTAAPAPPTVAVPSNGLLPNPGYAVNSKSRPDPLRLPLLDAWNFAIQRSITPTLSVTAAYIGNKGTHTLGDGDSNNTNPNEAGIFLPAQFSPVPGLALHFDPSVPQPSTNNPMNIGVPITGGIPGIAANGGTAYSNYLQRFYGGSLAACQSPSYTQPAGVNGAVLPAGSCGWTQGISYYADALDTHFNALQVTIAKQLAHGLSFTSNYQWARAFDYAAGYSTWNKSAEYGRDQAVREQQEVLFGVWQLPVGRGGYVGQNVNKVVDEFIGHWEISGTMNWAGGLPFTLSSANCGGSIPGSAPCYAYNVTGQRLPISYHKISPQLATYFTPVNSSAGQDGFVNAPLDTIGNVGRNNYFGPMFINADMAVQKNIPIHEAILAQFRMDAFNVFNHVNPGLPSSTVDNPSNGTITGENGNGGILPLARYLTFSLRVQF